MVPGIGIGPIQWRDQVDSYGRVWKRVPTECLQSAYMERPINMAEIELIEYMVGREEFEPSTIGLKAVLIKSKRDLNQTVYTMSTCKLGFCSGKLHQTSNSRVPYFHHDAIRNTSSLSGSCLLTMNFAKIRC